MDLIKENFKNDNYDKDDIVKHIKSTVNETNIKEFKSILKLIRYDPENIRKSELNIEILKELIIKEKFTTLNYDDFQDPFERFLLFNLYYFYDIKPIQSLCCNFLVNKSEELIKECLIFVPPKYCLLKLLKSEDDTFHILARDHGNVRYLDLIISKVISSLKLEGSCIHMTLPLYDTEDLVDYHIYFENKSIAADMFETIEPIHKQSLTKDIPHNVCNFYPTEETVTLHRGEIEIYKEKSIIYMFEQETNSWEEFDRGFLYFTKLGTDYRIFLNSLTTNAISLNSFISKNSAPVPIKDRMIRILLTHEMNFNVFLLKLSSTDKRDKLQELIEKAMGEIPSEEDLDAKYFNFDV